MQSQIQGTQEGAHITATYVTLEATFSDCNRGIAVKSIQYVHAATAVEMLCHSTPSQRLIQ